MTAPAAGGIPGPRLKEAHTLTRVTAYVTANTNATFNIEERGTIGVAGGSCLTAGLVPTTTGATQSANFADTALAADSWLWLQIAAVVGTPGMLVVTVDCTV